MHWVEQLEGIVGRFDTDAPMRRNDSCLGEGGVKSKAEQLAEIRREIESLYAQIERQSR